VTGEWLTDTDDERLRQNLARFLVEEKGYHRDDLRVRVRQELSCEDMEGHTITDIVIVLEGTNLILIRYGPGSLVTRERPALAAARTLDPTATVPLAVVTNGREAELLDVQSSRVIGDGLRAIPGRSSLLEQKSLLNFSPVSTKQRKIEERILLAYDGIEHSCTCTEDWCRTKST